MNTPLETSTEEAIAQIDWTRMAKFLAPTMIILGGLFYLLSPMLTPFLLGALLAYFVHPAVDHFAQWRIPRAVGAVLCIAIGLLCIVGFVLVVLPLV
ncbi:MAG: hypothetical protein RLZZ502_760, partial [Pseudomonadota bacterium]